MSSAQAALKAGDAHSAQAGYQTLLQKNKYDVDAIKGMAVCALVSGATDEAARWSRELLKYRPWDRDANLTAGKQAAEQGDFAEAANRLILAFIDSEFKLQKEEVKIEMLNLHRRIAAEQLTETANND
ncbi:MAG: hypothetical protein P9L94_04500 [Candidatus Hinthialibacter antarcticus]|nr:hypothetical protein [Candidatus Hinthialibacter antarcticus]